MVRPPLLALPLPTLTLSDLNPCPPAALRVVIEYQSESSDEPDYCDLVLPRGQRGRELHVVAVSTFPAAVVAALLGKDSRADSWWSLGIFPKVLNRDHTVPLVYDESGEAKQWKAYLAGESQEWGVAGTGRSRVGALRALSFSRSAVRGPRLLSAVAPPRRSNS